MSKNITVTFEDGSKQPYKNIPDTVTKEEFVARVKKDFPTKKIKQVDVEGPTVGQSAQAAPATAAPAGNANIANTSTPPNAAAAAQPEDDKDYRADFPNLFTPKNMKRNKAGQLIFQ